jgi:lambda repressor-like predicted transcriptional regulator
MDGYSSGSTLVALSREFGIHKRTVADYLMRAGIRPRYRAMSDEDEAHAAELYRDGFSLAAIGSRLGVNDCTVMRALHKSGVAMRPRRGGPRT